jgi:hypothetical protein
MLGLMLAYLAGLFTLPVIAIAIVAISRDKDDDTASAMIPFKRW